MMLKDVIDLLDDKELADAGSDDLKRFDELTSIIEASFITKTELKKPIAKSVEDTKKIVPKAKATVKIKAKADRPIVPKAQKRDIPENVKSFDITAAAEGLPMDPDALSKQKIKDLYPENPVMMRQSLNQKSSQNKKRNDDLINALQKLRKQVDNSRFSSGRVLRSKEFDKSK